MIAYNLSLQKAIASYDQTHVVKIGLTYDLPVGRAKSRPDLYPALNVVMGGWKIQYIGNYNSGTPLVSARTAPPPAPTSAAIARTDQRRRGLGNSVRFRSFNAALLEVSNPPTSI